MVVLTGEQYEAIIEDFYNYRKEWKALTERERAVFSLAAEIVNGINGLTGEASFFSGLDMFIHACEKEKGNIDDLKVIL